MKTLIIVVLATFIVASGVTMFLTGTFKHMASKNSPSDEVDLTSAGVGGSAQAEGIDPQPQGSVNASAAEPEAKLAQCKTQIAEQEKKLAAVRSEIASLTTAKASMTRAQQFEEIAKVYSAMKPDSAASILSTLEEDVTKRILKGMNTKTAGKIMDAIATANPDYAAKVTRSMAGS